MKSPQISQEKAAFSTNLDGESSQFGGDPACFPEAILAGGGCCDGCHTLIFSGLLVTGVLEEIHLRAEDRISAAKEKFNFIQLTTPCLEDIIVLFLCDWSRHIQESRGPLGLKAPKSLKKVFPGLPTRSAKNVSKKSQMTRKESKRLQNQCSGTFSTFFGHSGQGGPRSPF